MPDHNTPAQPDVLAIELRRVLDELGLDIDMHGAVIKVQNTPANVGLRADMALGRVLYRRLATLWPRGVQPVAEKAPTDVLAAHIRTVRAGIEQLAQHERRVGREAWAQEVARAFDAVEKALPEKLQ